MRQFAIFISGRGSNMKALLESSRGGNLLAKPAIVISNKADASGLATAGTFGVRTSVLDWADRESAERECLKTCAAHGIDFIVLAGFMKLLTPLLIDAYRNRILNIHPALLPSFPGLRAQRQAIECGARVSGCTTHFVNAGVDSGPIILQKAVPVLADDTEESLSERILVCEHELIVETVNLFAADCITVVDGARTRVDEDKFRRARAAHEGAASE